MSMYRPKNSSESSCYGVTVLRYYYGVIEPELGPKKMADTNFTHVVKFRDEQKRAWSKKIWGNLFFLQRLIFVQFANFKRWRRRQKIFATWCNGARFRSQNFVRFDLERAQKFGPSSSFDRRHQVEMVGINHSCIPAKTSMHTFVQQQPAMME